MMFKPDDPNAGDNMRRMFGPGQVDVQIRQAIHLCWMLLPDDKKTVDDLEKQLCRIVDRAIRDLREDADAFGLGKDT